MAEAAGARLVAPAPAAHAARGGVDDRLARGRRRRPVRRAARRARRRRRASPPQALAAGAWGVLVGPGARRRGALRGARRAARRRRPAARRCSGSPRAWRRELGAQVDRRHRLDRQDLDEGHPRRAAGARSARRSPAPQNLNTEIGLPLDDARRAAPGREVLVLEMAMRGAGQIAELAAIAEPDVGVIVNVGPVHLELLGSLEAIAAAKAELIAGLRAGGDGRRARRRAAAGAAPARRPRTVTFGEGGDVRLPRPRASASRSTPRASASSWSSTSPRRTTCSTCSRRSPPRGASASTPAGRVEVAFSALRGERLELAGRGGRHRRLLQRQPDVDARRARRPRRDARPGAASRCSATCSSSARTRRALPRARSARYAAARGVDVLVTVGPLAADMADAFDGEAHASADAARRPALVAELVAPGDTVLVKASRGVGPRGRRRGARRRRGPAWARHGRGPDRRHRLAAHLHLPVAEVHRVPARARVRPAHPRGGAGGPPREGGHADDGRDHHRRWRSRPRS